MQRTRLVFAFGTHGCPMLNAPANESFFKGALAPIFEDIIASGKKGVVIHEFYPLHVVNKVILKKRMSYESLLDNLASSQENRDRLMGLICSMENDLLALFRDGLDKGTASVHLPISDLGFFSDLAAANKAMPGSIASLTEPFSFDTLISGLRTASLSFGPHLDPGAASSYMEAFVKESWLRDLTVMEMAARLASEDGHRVIIVPRGFGHRHMAGTVDTSRFEMEAKQQESYPNGSKMAEADSIFDKACELFYKGGLGPDELRRFAGEFVELEMMRVRMA